MADRIDHAADAERLLRDANGKNVERAAVLVAAAHVRATLALVEQQRIANRIALAQVARSTWPTSTDGSLIGSGSHALWDYPSTETGRSPLKAEFREGLGL